MQKTIALIITILGLSSPALTLAGFGSTQLVDNVLVTRIFSGTSTTYVEFTSLPGCTNNGGYLTASWPAANGGTVNEDRTKQIVATLMFAKATQTTMEVRYRPNTAPTGWDSCAIDAVFLH